MTQKFIESINFKDGVYHSILLHQKRVNKTFNTFFGGSVPLQLESILPEMNLRGSHKVRVVYDSEGEDLEFIEYKKKAIRVLEVIDSEPFDYSFKFENRVKIDRLVKKSNADDIIISFEGKIKDSSYANLAFWDGKDWLTPENPLLEGVRRAQLLAKGKIKKRPIHISDLGSFEKVSLINAMLDLREFEIDIKNIKRYK